MPGAILGGHIADRFTIRQARKNHGISEAEHKLKLLLLPTVLAPFALLMMGLGPYYGAHWMVFVAGMFILSLIGPLAALLGISYAFDTFHNVHPRSRDGPQAEVQQCAPYLLCVMALCMILTFGFVSTTSERWISDSRTMLSPRGRSIGGSRTLQSRLRASPSRST